MEKIIRNMGVMLLTLLVAGCATTGGSVSHTTPTQAVNIAKSIFGESYGQSYWIPSNGGLADSVFIMQSKSQGPSAIAYQLAGVLKQGKESQITVTVAGPNSAKTKRVVLDALALLSDPGLVTSRPHPLPGLRLLFVGEESDRDAVEKAITSHGARFYFAPAL